MSKAKRFFNYFSEKIKFFFDAVTYHAASLVIVFYCKENIDVVSYYVGGAIVFGVLLFVLAGIYFVSGLIALLPNRFNRDGWGFPVSVNKISLADFFFVMYVYFLYFSWSRFFGPLIDIARARNYIF